MPCGSSSGTSRRFDLPYDTDLRFFHGKIAFRVFDWLRPPPSALAQERGAVRGWASRAFFNT